MSWEIPLGPHPHALFSLEPLNPAAQRAVDHEANKAVVYLDPKSEKAVIDIGPYIQTRSRINMFWRF